MFPVAAKARFVEKRSGGYFFLIENGAFSGKNQAQLCRLKIKDAQPYLVGLISCKDSLATAEHVNKPFITRALLTQ